MWELEVKAAMEATARYEAEYTIWQTYWRRRRDEAEAATTGRKTIEAVLRMKR
jgi:hypothetical protein